MSTQSATAQNPLLHLLKNTTIAMVASDQPDLTGRQLGVFLAVYLESPEKGHTVRGLAAKLNVSKPAITRALDRLTEFELVSRAADPADKRSVLVVKTQNGHSFLRIIAKVMNTAKALDNQAIAA